MNKWLYRLIALVVSVISPEIRKGGMELLNELEKKAKATPNPWDDIFVDMLKSIMTGV